MRNTWQWKPNQTVNNHIIQHCHHRAQPYRRQNVFGAIVAFLGAIIAIIMIVDLIAKAL